MYADRHDAFSQEDKRNMSWLDKEVIPRYEGIANRCLGILDGDHYLIFSNGMSSGQYICRQLGMPYLGERMAYVGLFFKALNRHSCQYNILARHGKGAASTAGGDVAALSRQSAQWISDLHLGGHTHRANIHCVPFLYPNQGFDGLRQRVVFYVRGGSFLQGYPDGKETYAENPCEYNPLCIGWAEIELTLNRLRENNNNLAVTSTSARLIAE